MNANLARTYPLSTLLLLAFAIGEQHHEFTVSSAVRDLSRGHNHVDLACLRRYVRDMLFLYGAWKL